MTRQVCNVIALYDFKPESCDLSGWFDYMVEWFESIDVVPQTMGLTTSQKLIRFENGKRKLEKNGFKDIKAINILGNVSEIGTNLNWKVSVEISARNHGLSYICFDNAIHHLDEDYLSGLIKDLSQFYNFKYGIGYQREFIKGPDWYVSGIIGRYGDTKIPLIEEEQISKWNREYFYNDSDYKTGLFRDVYPYNILTNTHLNISIQGITLEKWILKSSKHGALTKVSDKHWLWSLKEEQIPQVQEALEQEGLLLCYKV